LFFCKFDLDILSQIIYKHLEKQDYEENTLLLKVKEQSFSKNISV